MGSGGRNRREQNAWNAQARADNATITQQDPLEVARRAQIQRVLDWENAGSRDIRDLPGMSDHIQIGQAALQRAEQDRMGSGALQLAEGGSSGFATQLKELKKNELGREVGAGLENARASILSEAHGSVLPFSQLTTARNTARAGHSAQMFGMWNQRQSRNWWDYMREGVQMAGQAASMFTGGM